MPDVVCYRGVAVGNPHYADALQGKAVPRGGPAGPIEHNLGDTQSAYTSWTTDFALAREKALDSALGGRGVMLTKSFNANVLTASPDLFSESEVLVRGAVEGASVTWIP